MPTGYTYKVADGKVTDFETFAMQCARAFGACVTLRESPEIEIPKVFEPSDYHPREMEKARREVARFYSMTLDEAAIASAAEFEEESEHDAAYLADKELRRTRYLSMIGSVKAWTPPTPDHDEMKRFMLEQLSTSIDFDCGTKYHRSPERKAPRDWLKEKREAADRNLAYHVEENDKEIKRAADRTAWIAALRQSLVPAAAPRAEADHG